METLQKQQTEGLSRMTLRYDGQVALVTGGGRGLGRAYALELARRGAAVVVNDLGAALDGSGTGESPADDVAAEITAAGGSAIADGNTVATPGGAVAMVDVAVTRFGRIDIVINNAGIIRPALVSAIDLDAAIELISVHLHGTLNVSVAAFRHMQAQRYGRIVNVTSGAGLFGAPTQSSYSSAKMGVVGLTRVLALEGAEFGIKANAVSPSAVTRMRSARSDAEAVDLGPERVGQVVCLLAHEKCPLTGEVLGASGRHVARVFVGLTQGWTAERVEDWTPENILLHIQEVTALHGFSVPADFAEYRTQTLGVVGMA